VDAPGWLPPWDGAAYAANTGHHRAHDAEFLASLPLATGDRVLDVGCGSGDFTAVVAGLVPDGHVVGLDAQASMLEEARARAGANQSFVLAPAQQLEAAVGGADGEPARFDVAFSRAVLHWVPAPDLAGVHAAVARMLRPGGWWRVDCGGAGNVPAVVALFDDVAAGFGGPRCPWTFADPATAMTWLEAAGLDHEAGGRGWVRTVAQRRRFDEAGIRGWVHSQALAAYEASMEPERHGAFRAAVEERIRELRRADGTYDQTFVRLDLLARRPE
jgi:trans-aconitate methyltransferase